MRLLFLIVFWYCTSSAQEQTLVTWDDLSAGISWGLPTSDAFFPGFQKATFSDSLLALEGKKITLVGYLLVLDGKQSVFLLSKNPMASCFFCGNGGPETVVDLRFSKKPSFAMDELLSVEGTLYLNRNNPNASYFRIDNANAISFK